MVRVEYVTQFMNNEDPAVIDDQAVILALRHAIRAGDGLHKGLSR